MTKVRKAVKRASQRQAVVESSGRETFDALCTVIEQLQAAHPDRAIVLLETPPNVGASSTHRTPQVRKSLLQSISLHSGRIIWFNVVPGPGARSGSAGTWSAATMQIVVSELPRAELPGFVPERVLITEV